MIDWIKTKDQPFPKDGENYLAIFKGQFCLLAYETDDDEYSMMWLPNAYCEAWTLDAEKYEHKITYWAHLTFPEDY